MEINRAQGKQATCIEEFNFFFFNFFVFVLPTCVMVSREARSMHNFSLLLCLAVAAVCASTKLTTFCHGLNENM